jgi:hypothetical protein
MAAPLYRSTTRELSVAALPPALGSALRDFAAKHQLVLDGVRCWLTHSENPPATGFFSRVLGRRANPVDPDAEHHSLLVLHPTQILVGTSGEKRGTTILGVALVNASMQRGHGLSPQLAAMAPGDDGITLYGFPGEHGRPGSWFFGLGAGAAAEACVHAVELALRAVKNPAQS